MYKEESTIRTCKLLGIDTYCWQQRQERFNREIKAIRDTTSRRTVVDLLEDVVHIQRELEKKYMDAILRRGDCRLVDTLLHLEMSQNDWETLSHSAQAEHLQKFMAAIPRKCAY